MTRILYTITLAETGGAQGHLRDLAQLFNHTDTVALAVGENGPLVDELRLLGCEVFVVPALGREINVRNDLKAIRQLRQVIGTFRPDVVHAHSSKAGLLSRIAGRLESVPVLFTAHGWVFAPGAPKRQRIISWLSEFGIARIGGTIVCLSQFDRRLANRQLLVRTNRLATIPHGLASDIPKISGLASNNVETEAAEPNSPVAAITLLMVARFQEQKDHDTLLRAVAEMPAHIVLQLAGTGPLLERSKELASKLGVDDRVRFLGNRDDVPELLAAADIFVLLSRYEGLPISIMEAMRAGLAVVATDVCGVSEQVTQDVTGLLVPIGDVKAAAVALQRLAADPVTCLAMGQAGKQKFFDQYTQETMRDRYELLYQRTAELQEVSSA